jgi:hypothetical protein
MISSIAGKIGCTTARVDADGRIIIATRGSGHRTASRVGRQAARRRLNLQSTLTLRTLRTW